MTDVWKIGQESSANEYYQQLKNMPLIGTEVFAARQLAGLCDRMSESYDETIDEQVEYLTEIEELNAEIEDLKLQLEKEVKAKQKENQQLLRQQDEEGNLTAEAGEKINANNGDIENLQAQFGTLIDSKSAEVDSNIASAKGTRSKEKIATDYGETAVEKGKPLSETKDKRKSFWRKLSGSWDQSAKREAGKLALEAGENLLEKVNTSVEISEEINKKSKVSK